MLKFTRHSYSIDFLPDAKYLSVVEKSSFADILKVNYYNIT